MYWHVRQLVKPINRRRKLTEVEALHVVVGFLVPPLAALVKQSGWSKTANSVIALGVSLVVGLATAYYTGELQWPFGVVPVATVITVAFTSYKMFWQTIGFDEWLTSNTSIVK